MGILLMHLPTIPGGCTSAHLRHKVRVSNAFTHIFSYTYIDCHRNINMGVKAHMDLYHPYGKYSHCSVLIADGVPHTGGPLHRYLNIFMCLLTCARHHCPLHSPLPLPPSPACRADSHCPVSSSQGARISIGPLAAVDRFREGNFPCFSYSNLEIFKMENLEEQGRSIRLLGL